MPATALEQMILELVNRARLDPAAEAARDGIDLNEGVPANQTISATSKQPLAMNETLLGVARAHSQDMIDRDYFAHNTPEGVTPFQRMTSAGYNWTTAGENIALSTTTGTVTQQMTIDLHRLLFVDAGEDGRGHRVNILNGNFQEIGVGQVTGNYQGRNATALTQDFGTTGNQQFITGVSYADADHDAFYSIGEGRGAMSVAAASGPATTTGAAGGYSLAVGAGVQTITFSGGGLGAPVHVAVTVAAHTNAKVDMIDQGVIHTSASLTDLGGATTIVGLGTIGLTLIGDGGADTIIGARGNDVIDGVHGADFLTGASGADRFVFGTAALADAQASAPVIAHVTDYDQGNSGTFTIGEGDQIDLSALLAAAFNHGSGQAAGTLVRAFASGTGAALQVDTDGAANGTNWTTIAQLDGVHSGNSLQVLLDRPSTTSSIVVSATADQPGTPPSTGAGEAPHDFNADGHSDILLQNTGGSAGVWLMNGTGLVASATVGSNPGPSWHAIAAADFNNDDKADIVWQNDNGAVAIWGMDGVNVTAGGSVSPNPGPSWHIKDTGDFNGDGRADIVLQNDSGSVAIWSLTGFNLTSGASLATDPGPSWHIADTADFNGDGNRDIILQNDNGSVAIWAMDGVNVIGGASLSLSPGPSWHVRNGADFNGDGKADILLQNDNGSVAIWTMDGFNVTSGTALANNPGPTWHIKDAVDFNADHIADILWQNDNGSVAIWTMNGADVAAGTVLPPVSADWHVIA